jgi:hypothetical protein
MYGDIDGIGITIRNHNRIVDFRTITNRQLLTQGNRYENHKKNFIQAIF